MKKFAIVLAICMLLPLNAFALQPMSEDTMGQVTGQAGVSIAVDDVKIYQNIESLTYTDTDGVASVLDGLTDAGSGSVEISQLSMMVNVNAITSLTTGTVAHQGVFSPGRDVMGTYTAAFNGNNALGDTVFKAKALTIDVGEMDVLSAGLANNAATLGLAVPTTTVSGVRIGLPTVEVFQSELTFTVKVLYAGSLNGGSIPGFDNSFGQIKIGNMTMAVLDGFVEIAPH